MPVKLYVPPCDHFGRAIEKDETPFSEIKWWEIEPHLQTDEYTSMVFRSWQELMHVFQYDMDVFLERFTEDELEEGITIKIKLKSGKKHQYDYSFEDGDMET